MPTFAIMFLEGGKIMTGDFSAGFLGNVTAIKINIAFFSGSIPPMHLSTNVLPLRCFAVFAKTPFLHLTLVLCFAVNR